MAKSGDCESSHFVMFVLINQDLMMLQDKMDTQSPMEKYRSNFTTKL